MTASQRMRLLTAKCLFALVVTLTIVSNPSLALAETDEEYWAEIKTDFFGDKVILPAIGRFSISTPTVAFDAGLIPVTVYLKPSALADAKQIHLFVDRNPTPLAARIEIGAGLKNGVDIGTHTLTTRVRSEYASKVRAVLETRDGKYYMASVKVDSLESDGGCSSPTPKDLDNDILKHGNIRMSVRADKETHRHWREGTVRVRHPNITGMQMNPTTGSFPPAWYVSLVEIKQDEALIFRIHAGISLSRNPHFRFTYASQSDSHSLHAWAKDSKGSEFQKTYNFPSLY